MVTKSSQNKPFTLRKNFDGFEDKPEYLYIKKISKFLNKFPQIKPELYFKAPFMIYDDLDYISLDFFTTRKALKAYTVYMKQKNEESPDSKEHLEFIKESLRFIAMFCIKNKIPIREYVTHKTGVTYSWMKHFKEHNISVYVLFELPNIFNIVGQTPEDEKELFLGDIGNKLHIYKMKYMNSKEAINLIRKGYKKIITLVDQQNKRKKTRDNI